VGGGLLLGRARETLLLSRATETESDLGFGGSPDSESTTIIDLTGIAGYRWVSQGGWMLRLTFTPFLALSGDYPDSGFMPSGGPSFGYVF